MNRLEAKYNKEVVAKMSAHFGYKNKLAVPRVGKVVLNVGISATRGDDKFIELVSNTLSRISGQKPVLTKAKKSISSFKIREGNILGAKVTLRGSRMYEFLDKLIHLTLPNVRDFRGLEKKSLDQGGNLTIGFKEYLPFPEINPDEFENVHGLEVCVTTTARDKERAFALLSLLGFPFREKFEQDQ